MPEENGTKVPLVADENNAPAAAEDKGKGKAVAAEPVPVADDDEMEDEDDEEESAIEEEHVWLLFHLDYCPDQATTNTSVSSLLMVCKYSIACTRNTI